MDITEQQSPLWGIDYSDMSIGNAAISRDIFVIISINKTLLGNSADKAPSTYPCVPMI